MDLVEGVVKEGSIQDNKLSLVVGSLTVLFTCMVSPAIPLASELLVKRGDKVVRGQTIGLVGSTGNVISPKLHFEVRRGKMPLDPKNHLPLSSA